MHSYEVYLWSEITALLQSIEHFLNTIMQALAACIPVVFVTLAVGLVIGGIVVGMHYLHRAPVRPAHTNSYFTTREIVVTEAGKLAILSNLEMSEESIAEIRNMDHPSPERAACN